MAATVAPSDRQMRFELPPSEHDDARIMRAKTNLSNAALWKDMMCVYKKHPKEWISNRKTK